MKKSGWICMLIILLSMSFMYSKVNNPDKPLKNEWDFKLKQVWSVDKAGTELFASFRDIAVSDDGNIYLYDDKNFGCYIFTSDGKYVKTFAPRGEGPGEVKRFMTFYQVGDKLIVVDIDKLHFFTKDGKYIKSLENSFYQRSPDFFLNENEYIYFPLLRGPDPKVTGKIHIYNLKTDQDKVIADFPVYEGGVSQSGRTVIAMIVVGLTPLMTVGYDTDRIYYGISDTYTLNVADYNGKKFDSFSLERSTKKVSDKEKLNFFKTNPSPVQVPDDAFITLSKGLPSELTYFSRIDVCDKLVYVYASSMDRRPKSQPIDIFSPDGKYLYKSALCPGGALSVVLNALPILKIVKGNLYMAVEDEEGEVMLKKYTINLPKL